MIDQSNQSAFLDYVPPGLSPRRLRKFQIFSEHLLKTTYGSVVGTSPPNSVFIHYSSVRSYRSVKIILGFDVSEWTDSIPRSTLKITVSRLSSYFNYYVAYVDMDFCHMRDSEDFKDMAHCRITGEKDSFLIKDIWGREEEQHLEPLINQLEVFI